MGQGRVGRPLVLQRGEDHISESGQGGPQQHVLRVLGVLSAAPLGQQQDFEAQEEAVQQQQNEDARNEQKDD